MDYDAFYATLERWRATPWDWRTANCCQFASDIGQCWGIDFPIPTFDDVDDAAEWIRDRGHRSLYHYLVAMFGRPLSPLHAQRGWLVYRKGHGLSGSSIGTADRRAIFVGDRGLIDVPLAECACAFNPSRYRGG